MVDSEPTEQFFQSPRRVNEALEKLSHQSGNFLFRFDERKNRSLSYSPPPPALISLKEDRAAI